MKGEKFRKMKGEKKGRSAAEVIREHEIALEFLISKFQAQCESSLRILKNMAERLRAWQKPLERKNEI